MLGLRKRLLMLSAWLVEVIDVRELTIVVINVSSSTHIRKEKSSSGPDDPTSELLHDAQRETKPQYTICLSESLST